MEVLERNQQHDPTGIIVKGVVDSSVANRTQPKTVGQWIRYVVVAAIAIWLVIWMLRISGIDVW